MAKLLRFSLFSIAILSVAQQVSAQQFIYSLHVTPTGASAKNATSWRKAVDSPRFQIVITTAATSIAANPGYGGLGWCEITSSS